MRPKIPLTSQKFLGDGQLLIASTVRAFPSRKLINLVQKKILSHVGNLLGILETKLDFGDFFFDTFSVKNFKSLEGKS